MTKDVTQSPAFKEYMRLQEESFQRWSDSCAEGMKRSPLFRLLNKEHPSNSGIESSAELSVPPCPLCGVDHLGGK